jgi:UDP-3-O-[3-hydroxymyristoyl] glucosamine N-acyltransferase
MKLEDLAVRLGCRLEGDGAIEVTRLASLMRAGPGELTFLTSARYTSELHTTRASAVILGDDAPAAPCAMLRSRDPYMAFAVAAGLFAQPIRPGPGVDRLASISADAVLGVDVSIGPFVAIDEGVAIGDRTVIYPNVTIGRGVRIGCDGIIHAGVSIREGTIIGDRVILQDGAVVGSDGFGFARRADGTHLKIPQTSIVVIEDDVEIGANSAIDRPAIGETRIRAGAKIDNLVQVAHGVTIGRNSLLVAQVGVAGSTTIGDNVVLAGQVGVVGHLEIGDGVVASAQTGIPHSLEAGAFVSGSPAIPHRDWLKASAAFRRLPEMRKALNDLERRLERIERELGESRPHPPLPSEP